MTPLRVGAVGYLNARPLTWALDRDPGRWQIRYDLPAVCAELLRSRRGRSRADAVASSTCSRPTTGSCPGSASGRDGPVTSVALYSDGAAGRDPAHRARHQLAHLGGAHPRALPPPLRHRARLRDARTGPAPDDRGVRRGRAHRRPGARGRPRRARAREDRPGRRVDGDDRAAVRLRGLDRPSRRRVCRRRRGAWRRRGPKGWRTSRRLRSSTPRATATARRGPHAISGIMSATAWATPSAAGCSCSSTTPPTWAWGLARAQSSSSDGAARRR